MAHHARRKGIKADQVRELVCLRVLHNKRVDDTLARHEPVHKLVLGVHGRHRELLQILDKKLPCLLGVLGSHRAEAGGDRCLGKFVKLDCALHGHIAGELGEFDLNQLLGIQRAVPVPASSNRRGNHNAGRVRRLEDPLEVSPACDLLDEDGCQSFRPQLLVHTEKVDLHKHLLVCAHAEVGRDSANEADELLVCRHTHATVPYRLPSGGLQRPLEELGRIVKPKHHVVILDVVFVEQFVELIQLRLAVDVKSIPLESGGQVVGLLLHVLFVCLYRPILRHFLIELRNWLALPELVRQARTLLDRARGSGCLLLHAILQLHRYNLPANAIRLARSGCCCCCCCIAGRTCGDSICGVRHLLRGLVTGG
eukprot:Opistho-2@83450